MYVQLHVMIEKIPEKKLLLTVYARAHHCVEANSEPNFSRIAAFVNEFNTNPIKKLQEDFVPLSRRIGESLLPLAQMTFKWTDPKSVRDSKVFDLIEKIDDSGKTGPVDVQVEIMWMENAKLWVLIGFLVCPSELQKDGALALLQQVLSDTWVIPIFRDQSLEIHSQFRELYTRYKHNNWIFNDDVNKDFVKAGVNAAITNSGIVHNQHRAQLRWYLKQLTLMLQAHPGLSAPKFSLILAILAYAKSEIYWFFLHQNYFATPNFVIPKNKGQFIAEKYGDDFISELIFLVDKLQTFMSSPEIVSTVSQYYVQLIAQDEVDSVRSALELLTQYAKSNTTVKHAFEYVFELLQQIEQRYNEPDYLETIRMVLQRNVYVLSNVQSQLSSKLVKDICTSLNPLFLHTRHIDQQAQQLSQFGSLRLVWFFNAHGHGSSPLLDQIFQRSLQGKNGQPGHCIAFVRLLNTALENVHPYYPEEQKTIGQHAMRITQDYLKQLTAAVDDKIYITLQNEIHLENQCAPYAVCPRLNAAGDKWRNLPGFESEHLYGAVLSEFSLARKVVSEICCALRQYPTVVVYDHVYSPHEFLSEKISSSIRFFIRKLVAPNSTPIIEQPTNMLFKLKALISCYSLISYHIAIDVPEIIKQALLLELTDNWTGGGAGEPFPDANNPSPAATESMSPGRASMLTRPAVKGDSSILMIAKFYSQVFLGKHLAANGIFYSSYLRSFVSQDFVNPKTGETERPLPVEKFTNPQELDALMQLCGPNGFRCIEIELLNSIARQVAVLKEFLIKIGKSTLELFSVKYAEEAYWRDVVNNFNSADLNRAAVVAISIGSCLRFRADLRNSLGRVVQETNGALYEFLRDVHSRQGQIAASEWFGEKAPPRIALNLLEQLCVDAGFTVSVIDTRLRSHLFKIMSSPSANANLFQYLPELFGAFFASDELRPGNMTYSIFEEGHRVNAHLLADAAVALIAVYTVYKVAAPFLASLTSLTDSNYNDKNRSNSAAVRDLSAEQGLVDWTSEEVAIATVEYQKATAELNTALVENLQKLLRCVALAMLTVKPPSNPQATPDQAAHILFVMPIMEFFIQATKGLVSHSYVEQFLPYALVRHNYVILSNYQRSKEISNAAFDLDDKRDA